MHTKSLIPTGRVFIVGAGNVGSAAAYALMNQEFIREIIMVDIAEDLVTSQVMDLQHASALLSGVEIKTGDYSMLVDGDIIVITSGAAQKEGETRMDLATKNIHITKSILAEIKQTEKDIYIMLVSNPVDVLTFAAIKEMDHLKPGRIFGTGTTLDTARLRTELAKDIETGPTDIDAFILGEHGDTSFPAFSSASIHGIKLADIMDLSEEKVDDYQERVRKAAYKIIEGKGSTNFGIGNAISLFVEAIFNDSDKVTPASVLLQGQYGLENVAIGVPAVVNMEGVLPFRELSLSATEKEKLHHSAEALRTKLDELGY